jgi:aspartyl aminopeptidase
MDSLEGLQATPVHGAPPAPPTADDLIRFLAVSPTPYHAVGEMVRRLEAAGFRELEERRRWSLEPDDRAYVVRDGGSLVAFRVGSAHPGSAGFRLIGAHTDSPNLRVRPRPDVQRAGYRLIGVEPYGGVLLYTWLDRDLTLAGRVAVREPDGSIGMRLMQLPGAPLRIPSLAIHLNREVRDGLKLDPQRHLVPLWGPDLEGEPGLVEVLADHVGSDRNDVLGYDLMVVDTLAPALGGAGDQYMFAPRLDNLASCHTGLAALLSADQAEATQVLVANDHEETGSQTAEGAGGSFLTDVLRRLVAAMVDRADEQTWHMALAASRLVSADVAHAVHPNYADKHEPGHQPRFGAGPVLKVNANQSYATDAGSAAWFTARCRDVGVGLQHFVSRADLPCGTTIGPITAARLGIATVDVGVPLLSMHSCREQAAVADIAPMATAMHAHLEVGERGS